MPGQGLSLEVDEVMFRGRSKFQVCAAHRQCDFRCVAVQTQQHASYTVGKGIITRALGIIVCLIAPAPPHPWRMAAAQTLITLLDRTWHC